MVLNQFNVLVVGCIYSDFFRKTVKYFYLFTSNLFKTYSRNGVFLMAAKNRK